MAATDDKTIIEALVFSSEGVLDFARIKKVLSHLDESGVESIVAALNTDYESQGHAFRIRKVGGGYRMFTLDDFHPWLQKLTQARRESRLSPAAMETLAIIAYKQPVMRADIESIRGVQSGPLIRALMDKGLVKMHGREEVPGKPMLYGTADGFLQAVGLNSLTDLPRPEELK